MTIVVRLSSLLRRVLPIAAGAASGVVSSFMLAERASAPPAKAEPSIAAAEPAVVPSPPPAADTALAQRVAALEREPRPGRRAPEEPSAPPSVLEIEAERARGSAEQRAAIARIEAEPIDEQWSGAAAGALSAEITHFTERSGGTGKIERISCRTTGCVATLDFPSFAEAQSGYMRYVANAFGMRCAQSATLDVPDDASKPYAVDVAFTRCEREPGAPPR